MSKLLSDAWVIVPAYNESKVIGQVIENLQRYFSNIVVVDDCSLDDTNFVAKSCGVHVLRHPINLGQGASIQTGIEYVLRKGASCMITFDADGQHDVDDAYIMISTLMESKCDLIIGSRFLGVEASSMSAAKKVLLKFAIYFTNFTTGVKLTDSHNGLRAFKRSVAAQVDLKQNRMAHASEFIAKIGKYNWSYMEMAVHIKYTQYSISKGQKLTGAIQILEDLLFMKL
jgi:polyprenyl-phospho-N-acetylgalactosaminyl synthase